MNPFSIITKPIGCLCSAIGSIILGILLLAMLLLWGFNRVAPTGIEELIETRGGFPTQVDAAGWRLWNSILEIEDIIIENPPNFPERDFIHIRAFEMEASPRIWLQDEDRRIQNITLDITRFNWVLSEGGSSNLGLFARSLEKSLAEQRSTTDRAETASSRARVETWTIRLGTVEINDYSRGIVRREKFVLDYERTFSDGETLSEVIDAVAADMAARQLSPLIRQLLESVTRLPEWSGLVSDMSPGWFSDPVTEVKKIFD